MRVSEKLWNRTSELFQVVYSSATAVHMLSGEAYVRALRAHFLVQSALAPIILQFISPLSLIEQLSTYDVERKYLCYTGNSNDKQFPDEIWKYVDANDIEELHTLVEQHEQNKDTTLTSKASLKFCRTITRCKEYLSKNTRTAKLLIQYIHYINIMKQFIQAGRKGNWQNYLNVVRQILNLFSATTHFQYAKSARLYLQPPVGFPWLYNLFQQGYHTIRRSDRFWSGLLIDLAIEQSLMRTVKSRKGLKCWMQLTVECNKM